MTEFTSEQQELIKVLDGKYLSYIRSLHHTLEEYGYRVAALEKVLYENGLATPEQIHKAEGEVRALMMIEKAINPKIRAADETLRKLLEST